MNIHLCQACGCDLPHSQPAQVRLDGITAAPMYFMAICGECATAEGDPHATIVHAQETSVGPDATDSQDNAQEPR